MMITRRNFLRETLGAGAVVAMSSGLAKAPQPATAVDFEVPAGACDCHTHVFGDPEKYPFFSGRTYTPEPATSEELAAMHRRLHLQRVVVVQPSVYGTDNRATLDAVQARGADARGIAVIDEKTTEAEIDAMGELGICGIRLNLATGGTDDPGLARARLIAAIKRMSRRNWHVQIFTSLAVIAALRDIVATSPVMVVIDHFGGAKAALGLEQAGLADLLALVQSGRVYVKISGAESASNRAPDFSDFVPLARALIAANPDRVIWGTNWPHPGGSGAKSPTALAPSRPIDDGQVMNQLAVWAPDAAIRKKILVENPARLFGF
ncbi:MAG: hypothetical protein RL077_2318 [Verrucomicrobiota bacterium]